MSERIDYLDGWRGLAILSVLVSHFVNVPWLNLGRFGVDLFFVLSGLLMATILFEKRTPLGQFYRRRIARIFPVFYLYLVVALGGSALTGAHVGWHEIATLATFTRTYFISFFWVDPLPVGQIWSLNVEEHCYVLLALIAAITALRRKESAVLALLGLVTFLAIGVYYLRLGDQAGYKLIDTECAASGLLFSAAYRLQSTKWQAPSWAPVACLVIAPLCYLSSLARNPAFPSFPALFISPLLLAFSVNHLKDAPAWFLDLLRARWLRFLGLISYSLYLWQGLFLSLVPHWHVLAAAPAILTACASFYLFENPMRRWINGHWSARRTPDLGVAVESEPAAS